MTDQWRIEVDATLAGERLDRVLERFVPDMGLRGRRRMIEDGTVTVCGRPAKAGLRLREGMIVELALGARRGGCAEGVRMVRRGRDFAALFKPAGAHTEALAGRGNDSLEACLEELLPEGVLVGRLDRPTSGLVLAALGRERAEAYRVMEGFGQVEKTYAALVAGRVRKPLAAARQLDVTDRRVTRILETDDTDPARRTLAVPVLYLEERDATLLKVGIFRGARHQIRAHLACAGHPLPGDETYGGPAIGPMLLHHWRMWLPGFEACVEPEFPEWADWREAFEAAPSPFDPDLFPPVP